MLKVVCTVWEEKEVREAATGVAKSTPWHLAGLCFVPGSFASCI